VGTRHALDGFAAASGVSRNGAGVGDSGSSIARHDRRTRPESRVAAPARNRRRPHALSSRARFDRQPGALLLLDESEGGATRGQCRRLVSTSFIALSSARWGTRFASEIESQPGR
jgi:hypothetical protein